MRDQEFPNHELPRGAGGRGEEATKREDFILGEDGKIEVHRAVTSLSHHNLPCSWGIDINAARGMGGLLIKGGKEAKKKKEKRMGRPGRSAIEAREVP